MARPLGMGRNLAPCDQGGRQHTVWRALACRERQIDRLAARQWIDGNPDTKYFVQQQLVDGSACIAFRIQHEY